MGRRSMASAEGSSSVAGTLQQPRICRKKLIQALPDRVIMYSLSFLHLSSLQKRIQKKGIHVFSGKLERLVIHDF